MRRRYNSDGRRSLEPLSRPSDVLAAMRLVPLMKTQRHDRPAVWALQNGREVTASAVQRLIDSGHIVPRDGGLFADGDPQTYVPAREP